MLKSFLVSKALNDSNTNRDGFLLINNAPKDFDDVKEEIKNSNDKKKVKTKLYYCLKSRKNIESKIPKVMKTQNRRIMLLSEFAMCHSKKSKFIKEQETR